MGRVSDILTAKGSDVYSIPPDATVYEAIARMVDKGSGSLLVMDDKGIAGIFTERDYLRRVTLKNLDAKTTRVRDVMTANVICVERSKSIPECMAIMTDRRIRHLPVVDGAKLAGMISIGDLVKHMSKEQAVEIRFLTEYITGGS